MKLSQAKEYYSLGLLEACAAVSVQDDEIGPGWVLCVTGTDGRSWTLHTSTGHEKVYATLDSLDSDVMRLIGGQAKSPCWSCSL